MTTVTAVGLVGLLVAASPASAANTEDAIATGVATGVFSAVVCAGFGPALPPEELPEDSYARRGWLLGALGVYAAETGESDLEGSLRRDSGLPVSLSLKDTGGFKGQVGYRCHPNFSAEVDVEWLDGFDATIFVDKTSDPNDPNVPPRSIGGKIATVDIEPVVVTASLKGYPLTGRYQPFAAVGAGAMIVDTKVKDSVGLGGSATSTDTSIVMRFGGGLDFYATENVVLQFGVDYVLPFADDLEDFDPQRFAERLLGD